MRPLSEKQLKQKGLGVWLKWYSACLTSIRYQYQKKFSHYDKYQLKVSYLMNIYGFKKRKKET
jgi:hypothetical protein